LKEGEIAQTDEEDMGLTYAELCIFGRLRKIERLGPVSMFDRMVYKNSYGDVEELARKVKLFFTTYSKNRHKATTLPPSFFYDPEACDDNRFDMRPWLYATDWSYQFDIIDDRVKEIQLKMSEDPNPDLKSRSSKKEMEDPIIDLPPAQEITEEMK